jgi:hypothetical protein
MMTSPIRRAPRLAAALAALALALGAAGCLERYEDIAVGGDGTLTILHRLKGNPEEFREKRADALPSGAPWDVQERDVPPEDGKGAEHIREARARFASADAVPETFGPPGDPAPLCAKTSLTIAREGGTVRYTFVRRYEPRAYAWRERAFRRAFPEGLRRELERLEGRPLSPDLKRRAAAALLAFEREKAEDLLEEAIAIAAPERAGDTAAMLRARAALGRAIDGAWPVETVVGSLDLPAEEKAALDARFRDETVRAAAEAGAGALAGEDLARREALRESLRAAFEGARRVVDATEDLQDESFEVRVSFPVPVAAAAGATVEVGGNAAVFRFKGEDLRDAPLVLRVVAEGAE